MRPATRSTRLGKASGDADVEMETKSDHDDYSEHENDTADETEQDDDDSEHMPSDGDELTASASASSTAAAVGPQKVKEMTEAEKRAEEAAAAARREKYKDWPLKNIKEPHDNDVMYGRGGGTNHHPGNKRYRKLVEDRKVDYVNSKRLDKPLVALDIIKKWRSQEPPGRFLKLDEKTGTWNDVGDKKAREKTSQALREKAPQIRKQQEEERLGVKPEEKKDENDEGKESKNTRFAAGTKTESQKVKKAVLARDHSLGREYLQVGESINLEGFSWQDPFQSKKSPTTASRPEQPPPPPAFAPAGRTSSHGSMGMAPHHHTSISGPPPPPDYYGRTPSGGDRHRHYSNDRFESWGSGYYPPHPAPGAPSHQRSGSWTHPIPPPPPSRGSHHQRSGSWSNAREHSLSYNPLMNASIAHSVSRSAFDSSQSISAYWAEPVDGRSPELSPPPPPGAGYGRQMSGGPPPAPNQYRQTSPSNSSGSYHHPQSSPGRPMASPPPAMSSPPSNPNPYNVDMSIAQTWSGGEVRRTWSAEHHHPSQPPPYPPHLAPPHMSPRQQHHQQPETLRPSWSRGEYDSPRDGRSHGEYDSPRDGGRSRGEYDSPRDGQPGSPHRYSPGRNGMREGSHHSQQSATNRMPRPQIVKRDTSHQNENVDTKPSVKRAALNRDNSLASNRLKETFMPQYYGNSTAGQTVDSNGKVVTESEIRTLSDNLEQSNLGSQAQAPASSPKPKPLSVDERMSTIDHIAMDLMAKPTPFLADNRQSTIDALDLDLDNDPVFNNAKGTTLDEDIASLRKRNSITRPSALSDANRLTTTDLLELVEEPLSIDAAPSSSEYNSSVVEGVAEGWLAQI